jgi:hypothetical protein
MVGKRREIPATIRMGITMRDKSKGFNEDSSSYEVVSP